MNSVTEQLVLARAAELAHRGDFAAAETLLRSEERGSRNAAVLDLLARLRAQQGDHCGAERFWTQLLQQDPAHPGAIAGIRRIHRIRAQGMHGIPWRMIAAGLVVIAVAWLAGRAAQAASGMLAGELQALRSTIAAQTDAVEGQRRATAQEIREATDMMTSQIQEAKQSHGVKLGDATGLLQSLSTQHRASIEALQTRIEAIGVTASGLSSQLKELSKLNDEVGSIAKHQEAQVKANAALRESGRIFEKRILAELEAVAQALPQIEARLAAVEELIPKPPVARAAAGSNSKAKGSQPELAR